MSFFYKSTINTYDIDIDAGRRKCLDDSFNIEHGLPPNNFIGNCSIHIFSKGIAKRTEQTAPKSRNGNRTKRTSEWFNDYYKILVVFDVPFNLSRSEVRCRGGTEV